MAQSEGGLRMWRRAEYAHRRPRALVKRVESYCQLGERSRTCVRIPMWYTLATGGQRAGGRTFRPPLSGLRLGNGFLYDTRYSLCGHPSHGASFVGDGNARRHPFIGGSIAHASRSGNFILLRPLEKCWGKDEAKCETMMPRCSSLLTNKGAGAVRRFEPGDEAVTLLIHGGVSPPRVHFL